MLLQVVYSEQARNNLVVECLIMSKKYSGRPLPTVTNEELVAECKSIKVFFNEDCLDF